MMSFMDVCGTESSQNPVVCPQCNVTFSANKNLYKHLRNIHGRVGSADPKITLKSGKEACEICSQKFVTTRSLRRHMIVKHDFESKSKQTRKCRILCPVKNCEIHCLNHSKLREHLIEYHKIELEFDDFTFDSMLEFKQWKEEYETYGLVSYIIDSSAKQHSQGSRRYYHCHRSYEYVSQSKGVRRIKRIQTNKIGTACPSNMIVTVQPDIVHVQFWKTHLGHDFEIERTFLTKSIRTEIADKLSKGVSVQDILDDVRNTEINEYGLQRIHLLDRKDIYNIIRDYKIPYSTKDSRDNVVSAKLNVQKPKPLDDCAIMEFKEQELGVPCLKAKDNGPFTDSNCIEDSNITEFEEQELEMPSLRSKQNEALIVSNCIECYDNFKEQEFEMPCLISKDNEPFPVSTCRGDPDTIEYEEQELEMPSLQSKCNETLTNSNFIDMRNKLESILGIVNEDCLYLNNKETQEIHVHLDKIIEIFNQKSALESINNFSVQQNIEHSGFINNRCGKSNIQEALNLSDTLSQFVSLDHDYL